jgi:hypothetical protein
VRGTGAHHLLDLRPDALWILDDFIRPEAHHTPTFALYGRRPTSICLDLKRMMIAVDLDHEFPR